MTLWNRQQVFTIFLNLICILLFFSKFGYSTWKRKNLNKSGIGLIEYFFVNNFGMQNFGKSQTKTPTSVEGLFDYILVRRLTSL